MEDSMEYQALSATIFNENEVVSCRSMEDSMEYQALSATIFNENEVVSCISMEDSMEYQALSATIFNEKAWPEASKKLPKTHAACAVLA